MVQQVEARKPYYLVHIIVKIKTGQTVICQGNPTLRKQS